MRQQRGGVHPIIGADASALRAYAPLKGALTAWENMRAVRWLLLVPAAIGAWYAVFAAALFAYFYVERHFCPPTDLVSGFCANETVQQALEALTHLSVALSAIAVEVVASAMAPSHKEPTVWATLGAGLVIAGIFGFAAHAWSLFLAAAVGGTLGAVAIVLFVRAQAPNTRDRSSEDHR